MAQLVALAVPLEIMPLDDCSIISSVTVSLKQDDGDKGFRFKKSFIRFFSGSSDIFFSVPQQLNSAIPKQKRDVLPRHRSPDAMVMHIKSNGIEAT